MAKIQVGCPISDRIRGAMKPVQVLKLAKYSSYLIHNKSDQVLKGYQHRIGEYSDADLLGV